MRIVGIADTHGAERQIVVPAGDILVVAGDFCTYGKLEEVAIFNTWLGTLPHKHKVVVAGNHDLIAQNNYLEMARLFTNARYLDEEPAIIAGIKFYGCPWTPEFNDWAFGYPHNSHKADVIWRHVPDDTQVLITHGPPAGTALGKLPDHYSRSGEDCGCAVLRNRILELPKLVVNFCGHIHEGYGIEKLGQVTCMNVTVLDGQYQVAHPGTVFEL